MSTKELVKDRKNEDIIREYRETGNEALKDEFFRKNERFSGYIAGRFLNTGMGHDELTSIAHIGMIKAFNTFKLGKAIKFATYSATCMNNEILMAIRRQKKHQNTQNLEHVVASDDSGHELTLLDVTEDDSSQDIPVLIDKEAIYPFIQDVRRELNDQQTEIFDNMMLGDESLKQAELSKRMGLSQSYISRLETRIGRKVKEKAIQSGIIEGSHQATYQKPPKKKKKEPLPKPDPVETPVKTYKQPTEGSSMKNWTYKQRILLYYYLERKDLKQKDVAHLMGYTQGYISSVYRKFKKFDDHQLRPHMATLEEAESFRKKTTKTNDKTDAEPDSQPKSHGVRIKDFESPEANETVAPSPEPEPERKPKENATERAPSQLDITYEGVTPSDMVDIALQQARQLASNKPHKVRIIVEAE